MGPRGSLVSEFHDVDDVADANGQGVGLFSMGQDDLMGGIVHAKSQGLGERVCVAPAGLGTEACADPKCGCDGQLAGPGFLSLNQDSPWNMADL